MSKSISRALIFAYYQNKQNINSVIVFSYYQYLFNNKKINCRFIIELLPSTNSKYENYNLILVIIN